MLCLLVEIEYETNIISRNVLFRLKDKLSRFAHYNNSIGRLIVPILINDRKKFFFLFFFFSYIHEIQIKLPVLDKQRFIGKSYEIAF